MTGQNGETDQDIANSVLPVSIDTPAIPLDLNKLQPWHRARKQFIRERQWIYYAEQLINRIHETPWLSTPPQGIPELKYLTLPGMDYFEV